MIFTMIRLGRYAARAGNGQPQPPARFGIFGRTVCLLLFASVVAHWWRISLIVLAVTVVMLPVVVAIGRARQARPQRDDLAGVMRRWDSEGRR